MNKNYIRITLVFLIVGLMISFKKSTTKATSNNNDTAIKFEKILTKLDNNYPNIKQITTKNLALWLKNPDIEQPLLLDIREKKEYNTSHLLNALNIPPNSNFENKLKGINKNKPIVAYCSVGYRSANAVEKLQKMGYTNVVNYRGSIFDWVNKGNPVYSNKTPVSEVHPYNRSWGKYLNKKYHPKTSK